jgi:hypothetical protein
MTITMSSVLTKSSSGAFLRPALPPRCRQIALCIDGRNVARPDPPTQDDGPGLATTLLLGSVMTNTILANYGLRRLHKYMLETEKITVISDEMRAVVETEWPELAHKLPPAPRMREEDH